MSGTIVSMWIHSKLTKPDGVDIISTILWERKQVQRSWVTFLKSHSY